MVWRAFALAALVAAPAAAQEVFDGATARRMLFNERRAELFLRPHPSMSEAELGAFRAVADRLVREVPYYGAIAISPDEGVASQATIAAGNFHSVEAASAAVLAACEQRRASGAQPCAVVAEVRPRGWRAPQPLQLSQGATAEFRRDYRRGRGEKAFAISPRSGGFGLARGPGAAAAAVATCNAEGGAGDCRVVIGD